MSYKSKGGKLRKHRARDRDWTPLADNAFPAAFISRPPRRSLLALKFLSVFTADVAERARNGKPSLCFNEAHDYEFHTAPDVFAVARMSDDAPPVVMGICPDCAKQSDAEIFALMRSQFRSFGLGETGNESSHARVEIEIANVATMEVVPGVRIAIALPDKSASPHDCKVAAVMSALIRKGVLRRFMAFRLGAHNCHAIVEQLYFDFKDLGIHTQFDYKRGSSPIIASERDPKGLHSWIEADGWAVDASGGATEKPILVQRTADFYALMKMTNVHDIEIEKGA